VAGRRSVPVSNVHIQRVGKVGFMVNLGYVLIAILHTKCKVWAGTCILK
jgi:hypothetical protein